MPAEFLGNLPKKSDNAPYAQALCGVALATFSIIQHFSQIEKRVFWKFFKQDGIAVTSHSAAVPVLPESSCSPC